eukprot:2145789-Prymnesium_polylepis.1
MADEGLISAATSASASLDFAVRFAFAMSIKCAEGVWAVRDHDNYRLMMQLGQGIVTRGFAR